MPVTASIAKSASGYALRNGGFYTSLAMLRHGASSKTYKTNLLKRFPTQEAHIDTYKMYFTPKPYRAPEYKPSFGGFPHCSELRTTGTMLENTL